MEQLADITYDCQILTSKIQETEYFKQLERREQEMIAIWLVTCPELQGIEGVGNEEERIFAPSTEPVTISRG